MTRHSLLIRILAACATVLTATGIVWAQGAETAFVEKMVTPELLTELRKGGYVLYMRHGTTDNSRADRAPSVDLNDCSTQRVLNDEGRKLSAAIGQELVKARIPVGEVFFSPLCRARESAELAFPAMKGKMHSDLNLAYSANLTAEEKKPVLAATRKLVSAPVAPGTNRVLVAHAPNMADLMGYFVKPEGTVVVLRPLGQDRFEYLGSIPPTLWATLLK
ncbi:histidine phosphatase family protein [Rhodoferax sp. GW822-FHT02A01]|uniref:histidine phosphatase family protein n=1 Tax=Rhodoferax sp. GW822-FHT02A01 TaxID=3141537 RepID=UPI00315CC172